MAKKTRELTASTFMIILSVIVFLLVAGCGALFYFGYTNLRATATVVSERKADAQASEDTISNLQLLQTRLDDLEEERSLLNQLTSRSELPQFEAESNIRRLAAFYNVSISEVTFVNTAPTNTPNSSSGRSATATPASQAAQISFSVGTLPYTTLLQFLNAIENNMPKLSVASISLTEGSTRTAVTPEPITITIATGA